MTNRSILRVLGAISFACLVSPVALSCAASPPASVTGRPAPPSSLEAERALRGVEFSAMDRDGDGLLLGDEMPASQRPWLMLSDRGGDGAIDLDDYIAFTNEPGARFDIALPDSISLIENIPYADTDHHRQQVDVLIPVDRTEGERLPVIAYIHGGAWSIGSRMMARPQVAPHVASGRYAAVAIGYRLSGEARYPAQIHDVKAGIRWIRAHADEYGFDPDCICAMGSSAGGHLTALVGTTNGSLAHAGALGSATDRSSDVACAIDLFGPTDLTAASPPSRPSGSGPTSREALLGEPDGSDSELARSASPLWQVDASDPPFLIIHGTADPLVPYSDSVALDAALREAGVPSTLITVEGGGHGDFFGPETTEQVRQFLDTHVGGGAVSARDED